MTDKTFTIEVNGVAMQARPGQMLIEVTDSAGVYIPRFCYHEKLSVAANCRMCLVEVEKAPKPLPACATPVSDGMKVQTRSPRAIAAQKAVMEFLLINHPLDCPICDQGGECELQDLAMGYGRDVSRFTERKRSVSDMNLGPLVSTDMTRCIHCTRCVRFGTEIAGIQELGTLGRGEKTTIGTYIERSVNHELSGNIIDLCPVGALNNKPYRFSARAWEMVQVPTVSPHDCFGSNLHAHVLNGRVKRVVPRANEAVNETWLSDRDRFSYEGIYADDRVIRPMVRVDGELRECDWGEALAAAATALKEGGDDSAALISPSATVEEGYLAARLLRHVGAGSIDFRLRQRDFRAQDAEPVYPALGVEIGAIDDLDAVLVIGSNLRRDVPLLAHRLRKAALRGGQVSFLNPETYEFLFPVTGQLVGPDMPAMLEGLLAEIESDEASAGTIATSLRDGEHAMIWLGPVAVRHPRYAELRSLAARLAHLTGATLGFISDGANSAGLSLAGALPHRDVGGTPATTVGRDVAAILRQPPAALLLLGVEPGGDFAEAELATQAVSQAGKVIAMTAFLGDTMRDHADVILPIGTFAETSGTFVNAAGDWQSFTGVAAPLGEARPGWKVLRVLGNLLELPDCDYEDSESIRDELHTRLDDTASIPAALAPFEIAGPAPEVTGPEILEVPIYQVDALVRRARSLQLTRDAQSQGDGPRLAVA